MARTDLLEELTRTICADPRNTEAILVCADHLEERGDARAQYLRGQVALRGLAPDSAARRALQRELRALYPANRPSWLARLEQAGAFEHNLTGLPAAWWGQDLPGRPGEGTYTQYPATELPGLPCAELEGDFCWLRETPQERGDPADACDPEPWGTLLSSLEERGFAVPAALRTLMTTQELQRRIPSSTANYFMAADELDPDRLQEIEEGVVYLPFYSDQQSCVRWGVWLGRNGEPYAPVLSAGLDWGDEGDEEGADLEADEVPVEDPDQDLRYVGFELAAPTVESFMYRTWIENRIWYATVYDKTKRELLGFEKAYLERYGRKDQ